MYLTLTQRNEIWGAISYMAQLCPPWLDLPILCAAGREVRLAVSPVNVDQEAVVLALVLHLRPYIVLVETTAVVSTLSHNAKNE